MLYTVLRIFFQHSSAAPSDVSVSKDAEIESNSRIHGSLSASLKWG
jgi:hypothetical protein